MFERKLINSLYSQFNLLNNSNNDSKDVLDAVEKWSVQHGLLREFKLSLEKESSVKDSVNQIRFVIDDLEEIISENICFA